MSYTREEILAGLKEAPAQPKHVAQGRRDFEPGPVNDAAFAEALAMLAQSEPAIEGQGGQGWTGTMAIRTLALIPDPDRALEAMGDWNARCEPPWDQDELLARLQRAAVEARIAPGSKAEMAQAKSEAIAEAQQFADPGDLDGQGVPKSSVVPKRRFYSLAEARKRPKPKQHFDGVPTHGLAVVWGEPDSGKTWGVIDWAMHLATGKAGYGRETSEPLDVVYYAGEGFSGIAHKRTSAWLAHYGLAEDCARLWLTDLPPDVASTQSMEQFKADMDGAGLKPALIVFDTYARVMSEGGLSENDPNDVGQYVKSAEWLKKLAEAEGRECLVLAIHHSGKNTGLGARGSNSLYGAVEAEWHFEADWANGRVLATNTKQKDWERAKPVAYSVLAKVDEDGQQSGLVLEILTGKDAQEAEHSVRLSRKKGAKVSTARLDNGMVGAILARDKNRVWAESALAADLQREHPELGGMRTVGVKLQTLRDTTGGTAFYVGKMHRSHDWKWHEIVLQ